MLRSLTRAAAFVLALVLAAGGCALLAGCADEVETHRRIEIRNVEVGTQEVVE
jgi:hypothetical protein